MAILGLAWFQPQWLGPRWVIDFDVTGPGPDQMLLIAPDSQTVVKELRDDDWVDAGQGAIRQGDVEIQIEGAHVAFTSGSRLDAVDANNRPSFSEG